MNRVYLSLGSNLGDRCKNLQDAVNVLSNHSKIKLLSESAIYETAPFGNIDQPDFLNNVISIITELTPNELLDYIHQTEERLGRVREIHWGPRTIDIDILLFNDDIIKSDNLLIPHPYLKERLFVLIPLAEIYSGEIPGESRSITQLIEGLDKIKGAVKAWRE